MNTITTSDGHDIIVSDEDYEYLRILSWCTNGKGSVERRVNYKISKMHHEIARRMGLDFALIDHKDRNWKNNHRDNLRPAGKSTNGMNRGPQRGNMYSSYKGVTFSQQSKKWKALIQKEKRQINIGEYATEDEAALAYNHHAMVLFGEFAYLNVVE